LITDGAIIFSKLVLENQNSIHAILLDQGTNYLDETMIPDNAFGLADWLLFAQYTASGE
jgi:hypothetical protein